MPLSTSQTLNFDRDVVCPISALAAAIVPGKEGEAKRRGEMKGEIGTDTVDKNITFL